MSSILKKRPVQGQVQEESQINAVPAAAVEQQPKKQKEEEKEAPEDASNMQHQQMQESAISPQPDVSTATEIGAGEEAADEDDDDDDDDETTKDSAGEREKAQKQWLKPPQTRSPRVGAEFQADI